jgi:hypothetical protein
MYTFLAHALSIKMVLQCLENQNYGRICCDGFRTDIVYVRSTDPSCRTGLQLLPCLYRKVMLDWLQ